MSKYSSISNIQFEITPIDELTDTLMDVFSDYVFSDEDKDSYSIDVESQLADFIEEYLIDDLYCLVEFPYVDKVYRDSYYSYFSSKHYNYKRDCIRVSLFKNEITSDMFTHSKHHEFVKANYLGYFIIRPLKNSIFGRSHINPQALSMKSKICSFESESMILGVKVKAYGFPHSSQDEETISCAETTIWGLMEYFGNKYAEYKPTLPSSIIKTLKSISYERQLPTNGLTISQISYALKEYGFGTRIYSRETYGDEFNNIINYYIESGIPVVLGLETKDLGHAVIGIGRCENHSKNKKTNILSYDDKDVKYIDYATFNERIVIQDDNHSPYLNVEIDNIGEFYPDGDEMQDYKVTSLIVPLYPKIYLEATIAKELFLKYITLIDPFGHKFSDNFIFRMFLASSRSFKSHISQMDNLSNVLKFEMLRTKMPKFIWCAEIYEKPTINSSSEADAIIILDATEANHRSIDSLILASYPDRSIFMVDNNFVALAHNLIGYRYYSNLN